MDDSQPTPTNTDYQQVPPLAYQPYAQQTGQPPKPPKQNRILRAASYVVVAGACLGIGVAIGSGSSRTVTKTVTVQGPVRTVTVPGPATTVTVTETPPPPPAGTTLGKWSGKGNENTPAFNAPASGDYIVFWTYSGNSDPSLGGATNFSIQPTDQNAFGADLPNDIASSGSGSTEITGVTALQSFNVQATGSWTIKVVSAP